MAVHRLDVALERLGDHRLRRVDDATHHHLAVQRGELLRPADGAHVVVEVARALLEVREVAVGQIRVVPQRVLLRQLDEHGADRVADAARARMQHEPHRVLLVEADLDEVVAAAERAEVITVVGFREPRVVAAQLGELGLESRPCVIDESRHLAPRARIAPARCTAVRHRALDRRAQRPEVVGQVRCGQRGLRGDHAAADVDADRSRNDRLARREHGADGRADAVVHVRHRRDVVEHHRKPRGVLQLALRLLFERHAARPQLQRHAAGNGLDIEVCFHRATRQRSRWTLGTRSRRDCGVSAASSRSRARAPSCSSPNGR